MDISFDKLPVSLEELMALPYASLNEPEYSAALYVAVMMNYLKDKDQTYKMLEFLKGPYGLTPYEKSFLADRMADGDHVVRSFFEGTSPENDYTPSMPYTIEAERGVDGELDGRIKIYMTSSGADSKRHILLRHKPSTDQWFVEDQMLLAMIRPPKSEDPWA